MSFYQAVRAEIESPGANVSITNNGAIGYRTTGKALLDLNFSVASLRDADALEIIEKFSAAWRENPDLAIKWLFYARDIREGLGERDLFRCIAAQMATTSPDIFAPLLEYIPEYGRWDDLILLLEFDVPCEVDILRIINKQFKKDMQGMLDQKSISLMAKWMPSLNASSKANELLAKKLCAYMHLSQRNYRKCMSNLRAYLDVVERKMSAGEWDQIDYSRVPSNANLLYRKAFLRHDEERRMAFLEACTKGEAKINSSVLYPHDIIHRVFSSGDGRNRYALGKVPEAEMQSLQVLWDTLPKGDPVNTIVMMDGSSSMFQPVAGQHGPDSLQVIEVAIALTLYFAQRTQGEFKNKFITFSRRPQLIDLRVPGVRLDDQIRFILKYDEVANTNIYAAFNKLLCAAINGKVPQEEMPKSILVISDMEFDACARGDNDTRPNVALFEQIQKEYADFGYQLPRLIFWNVAGKNSTSGTIPMIENDLGVTLISGFSVHLANMVMSEISNPYDALCAELNGPRYEPIKLKPIN